MGTSLITPPAGHWHAARRPGSWASGPTCRNGGNGISVKAGIQPVFVLEANSPEKTQRELSAKHEAMRQVAAAHNVPVIDMHAYLGQKYDEGFLWWDSVHLTDFGQELVAEKLHTELVQVMKDAR